MDVERRRRQSWRRSVNTNEGNVEMYGTDHAHSADHEGNPIFLTHVRIATGPYYADFELSDAMLLMLGDLIAAFLNRPAPPVVVKVELLQEPSRKRKKRTPILSVVPAPDDEVAQIKARMLAGR
jgi:hypothetical protein